MGDEETRAVSSVLNNGQLTSAANMGGNHVQLFEQAVSSFLNAKYVVSVNSGTAALQAALYALNIKQGDEILIPSFTFVATANAVASVGAKPVFVDILRENYTMDPDDLAHKITKHTRAIMPVHLYGDVAMVDQLAEIARKNNLDIIEDSAQSLGSTLSGKYTGTFFDLGCFSMYPAKVATAGEGGFVVTNNKLLRDKLLMIRNHGIDKDGIPKIFGLNLRLPELSAAIGSIQMKKLPDFIKARRRNAAHLTELLSDLAVKIPRERKHVKANWYLYTIATDSRDKLIQELNRRGVNAVPYYSVPIHKTHSYLSYVKLAVTDWASSHVLSLPVHPGVSPSEIEFIAKIIRDII